MLLESAPFMLAGVLLARAPLRWNAQMVPYLGCGCGAGPSARSLPAAIAAWLAFGPAVAVARFAAALAASRARSRVPCEHAGSESLLAQLATLLPLAIAGAGANALWGTLFGMHAAPAIAFVTGAGAAFAASPCGIGAVALASALRTISPAACAGFLCVAGIVDWRTWIHGRRERDEHDALAYVILAAGCAIVAGRGGAGFVHPKLAIALWPCAAACSALAWLCRTRSCARLRIAPIIVFAGAIMSAPLPQYHATETMLPDAFAGERIDFTGVVTRTESATTLVRYAITCCRADASPLVLRLLRPPPRLHGWVHVAGTLAERDGTLQLHADRLQPVDAPADPFVYR